MCDITLSDGVTAKITSAAHGLFDGQRITIADSTNFNGTFAVRVEDADTFFIDIVAGPFADESSVHCNYATVTTQSRSTVNSILLESANHGFKTDQKAIITSTTNYNSDKQVFVKSGTTFTIPVDSLIATESSGLGLVTGPNIYVRTDVGPTKIDRGVSKGIGAIETDNLMSFIGMDNTLETHPNYFLPSNYNALDNQVNFNSDLTDNLTQRVSKLTAMMADKAQDKTIKFNYKNCSLVANNDGGAGLRSITFSSITGSSPIVDVILPGVNITGTIDISSAIVLDINQSAYITITRNASFSIVVPTVADTSSIPVAENIFIVATRKSDTSVFLADSTELIADSSIALLSNSSRVTNQNLNIEVIEGGTWSVIDNAGTLELTLSADAYINVEGLAKERNTIDAQQIDFISVGDVAYITLNRNTGATDSRTVIVADISAINNLSSPDILIIAERTSNGIMLFDKSKLKDGESKSLGEILDSFIASLTSTIYEEYISIIAGIPSIDNELQGPVVATTVVTIPLDSKNGDALKQYKVGKGSLQVWLNGIYLLNGDDYSEIGTVGTLSNTFVINVQLEILDTLTVRINNA